MQRNPNHRSPLAATLVLVGATLLFAGCGDQGAHLPAGMTGSSAAALGGNLGSNEDPVLAGYDGIASVGDGGGDLWGSALNDWSSTEGSMSTVGLEDPLLDDPMLDGGYGGGYGYGGYGGYGYGNDYGYGGLSMASLGGMGGYGGIGGMGAYGGMDDFGGGYGMAGMGGVVDDPALLDGGMDPGLSDPGLMDAGFDPGMGGAGGFVDPGVGVADAGFSGGFDVASAPMVDTGGIGGDFGGGVVDVSGPSAVF